MATIKTYLRSYDASTLTSEPVADTWEELRDTFGYLKAHRIELTIEHIGKDNILLGAYCTEGKTFFLRIDLNNLTY